MVRKILATTAIAVMATATMGAAGSDYRFPSSTPPGDLDPQTVTQYVSFIWDDNGYSGELGTQYEYDSETHPYAERSTVGGATYTANDGSKGQFGPADTLKIEVGEMGLSWAVETLGKKMLGKGVDGGDGHMTFNMISGLFVPTWGPKWYNRESAYGSYINGEKVDDGDDKGLEWKIAASNGREGRIGIVEGGDKVQESAMLKGVKKMIAAGHEIGNHTIDHIETNSPYPKSFFESMGMEEGFDDGTTGKNALGDSFDEAAYFGTAAPLTEMGWLPYVGKVLSTEGWTGIIKAGAEGMSADSKDPITEELFGFRAPRLEINSAMFEALANEGYLYDCGVEEGMEENMDGTNFLWPYTVDNGVPNFTTQEEMGETIFATSFPQNGKGKGMWEIPVNLIVVDPDDRENVLAGHNVLAMDGEGGDEVLMSDWDGKITGFDFNMFILWAMTKDEVLRALKYTFDLHYDNNRAPMQVGCHTDYFTPIYDNYTLESDGAFKYALPQYNSGHGNTWEDRKATWEEFVDYAAGKDNVEFVSGVELITAIKAMQVDAPDAGKELTSETEWVFYGEGGDGNEGQTGAGFTGKVDFKAGEESYGGFLNTIEAGDLDGLTHISFNYNTNSPLKIRLIVEGDMTVENDDYAAPWEVTVNNNGKDVNSGRIPLSAFQYGPYGIGSAKAVATEKIIGIEIAPMVFGKEKESLFGISNFMVYGASSYGGDETDFDPEVPEVPVEDVKVGISSIKLTSGINKLGINSVNSNGLKLNIPAAGRYNVSIFSANGRVIKSFNGANLTTGINNLKLNSLSTGIYMIKVQGLDTKTSLVKSALIK
jgi:hypothetical protein